MVLKTQQGPFEVSPVGNPNPKIYETTKKHVVWQTNPNFCSNHECSFKNRTTNDLSV